MHREDLAARVSQGIPSGFITDFPILLRKILVTFGTSYVSLRLHVIGNEVFDSPAPRRFAGSGNAGYVSG